MKSATWIISVYYDDAKENIMFEKSYKNVKEIVEDFNISSTFIYNCIKEHRLKTGRKNKTIEKYQRMKIKRILHNKHKKDTVACFSI